MGCPAPSLSCLPGGLYQEQCPRLSCRLGGWDRTRPGPGILSVLHVLFSEARLGDALPDNTPEAWEAAPEGGASFLGFLAVCPKR